MRAFALNPSKSQIPVSQLARSHAVALRLDHRASDVLKSIKEQPHAEEVKAAALTGTAPRQFDRDFSRIPVHPSVAGVLQPKLAISKPGDEYEQEAERVAERVMRIPEPRVQRACACGGQCPKCQTQKLTHQQDRLQPKHIDLSDRSTTTVPPIVDGIPAASGQPLNKPARAFMESRFGHDFSRVRVHTDGEAATAASAIGARAYTLGHHIVFGSREYAPATNEGKQLLAHELAHVVQQQNSAPPVIARQKASRSEKLSAVWHVGALAAYRANELAEEGKAAVAQTGLPGRHNGPADAWRHCYWSCRMTQVIGKDQAAFIAENHEDKEEHNPTAERMMDTWNNEEGRDCAEPKRPAGSGAKPDDDYATQATQVMSAAQSHPAVDCGSACKQKLDAGKLWTLEHLGGDYWGGGVQSSKPTRSAGAPSVEKYKKY